MTRLGNTFSKLRAEGRKALVVYLTAGDPDFETSRAAAMAAVEGGADVLELGVPFSDPVADGPVIQQAMGRALAAGGGLEAALQLVASLRRDTNVPIVLFGYVNPLLWDGIENTCRRIAEAGADGMLVVDVPHEEAAPYRSAAAAAGLDWVSLVAPTTPPERAAAIAKEATGFLYVVSMTGVTGGALNGVQAIEPLVKAVRQQSTLPLCVGFGVRDQHTAALAARAADGVVVGSAIVQSLGEGGPRGVKEMVTALRAGANAAAER